MAELLQDPVKYKVFDISECATPTCDECTGSYTAEGLGIKFHCRCKCHEKTR